MSTATELAEVLLARTYVDPDYAVPAPGEPRMCRGCGVRQARDVHHREHKQMGGRHGAAKIKSEAAENKIALCRVCHSASHLIRLVEADGFCCDECPLLQRCYYGLVTLQRDPGDLRPGW